jgi:hypothetical protein
MLQEKGVQFEKGGEEGRTEGVPRIQMSVLRVLALWSPVEVVEETS